ncbi:MAG: M14-type cytosolic carboxypeptidase [Planctomycetota bacterium]
MASITNPPVQRLLSPQILGCLAAAFWIILTAGASAQPLLFSDDLSTGAGWQYSHFGGTAKPGAGDISAADFGFDYSVVGIPEAPNSALGDATTSGLRLAANLPGGWPGDQVAAVYEDAAIAGQYTLQVDVWMNYDSSGTTEHVGVSAGFDLNDAQFSFSPGQNGAGVAFSGDGFAGCSGSSTGICDYILLKDGARLDLNSGQYEESSFGTGNRPGYNQTNSNANIDLPALFPAIDIAAATGGLNSSGTQQAGALGFQWVTVTIEVDPTAAGSGTNGNLGTATVSLESHASGNSFTLGTIDNSVTDDPFDGINSQERPVNLEGGIGLFITDYFSSQATDPNLAFALFDNVRVFDGFLGPVSAVAEVPEPSTVFLSLAAVAALAGSSRRRARRLFIPLLAVLLVGVVGNRAQAVLSLTGNFDHGSLQSWTGDLTSIDLTGRDNYYGDNEWRWMYFEASGVQGAQPVFTIDQPFAGGNQALTTHKMVYSYDNENWSFFDNGNRSGNVYTFSNNSAFTGDTVWVAYAQPYSYERSATHTAQVLASPWAMPTVSGDANGVIGESPLNFDDLGRLVPKRDAFAYRITNPATDSASPKRKIVISTGMHAGEVLGTHTFEAMVNWLISDDARAARLRDDVEIFAYPTMNSAGRFAGNNRGTVENPTVEPNGQWNPFLWVDDQIIKVNGEAMIADVQSTPGTVVDAYIDFHSTIPTGLDDFGFIEIDQGDNLADFWVEFRNLQPNVDETDSTSTNWTAANFAEAFLGAEVDITFETEFGNNRPLSYYQTLGENFGIAFYNAWVQVPNPDAADFDEDGDVDAADLAAWENGFSIASGANHWDGDADGDGDVDLADVFVWQQQEGNGVAVTAAASVVPEPAAATLTAIALAAGTWVLRFRR